MTTSEVAAYNRDLAARITEASRRAWAESLSKQQQDKLLEWARTPEEYNPADDAYRRGFAAGKQAAKEMVLAILNDTNAETGQS